MLLERLVVELEQRFAYEKRASVCLWFDERREFAPLAAQLARDLGHRSPSPFALLAYDAAARHGQLWIKRRISQGLAADEPDPMRFVVYLPLAEDAELDLLMEYRLAGVQWRIDGKQPTLFRFLRAAGVPLTSDPAEQRRFRDGGEVSLLARYAARFAEQPAHFWMHETLTPALAQERLLGDLDRRILDIAVDPPNGWRDLVADGVEGELTDAAARRYGYVSNDPAAGWIRGLVEQVALTETYEALGEPFDFPFEDRLPPPALRPHHLELLRRWERDSEARGAWDNLIAEVERDVDLAVWARDRPGLPFAFPHLVAARWRRASEEFETAAPRASAVQKFLEERGDQIQQEAAHSRTSTRPVGAWQLLDDLRGLLANVAKAEEAVARAHNLDGIVDVFLTWCAGADGLHVQVRAGAERAELPAAATVADRAYAQYTNVLNSRFFGLLAEAGSLDVPGVQPVSDELAESVWNAKGRRAVVIVDALRLDCAHVLARRLDAGAEVRPVRAELPTITPVGMTALLPPASASLTLAVRGSGIELRTGGRDLAVRANRLRALVEAGADCREIDEVEGSTVPPQDLGELLVVVGHDDVDQLGHSDGAALIRHLEVEIDRIVRLVERLHRWGYREVHVLTDHGFVLLDEQQLPEEVRCDRAWCALLKPRFALVPARADLPLTTFRLPWSDELRVAVPPGLAFFKAERSFSHGGASLQELVIPHVVSTRAGEERPVGIEIEVPVTELVQTVVRVVVRPEAPAQLSLAAPRGRTLALDVLRDGRSVLASGAREITMTAGDEETRVPLFFATAESFRAGETLTLEVRDVDTGERFPARGTQLRVARDM